MSCAIRQERLSFPSASGARLAARLDVPGERPPRAFALFAHCFSCSKDLEGAHWISRSLAELGYGVLRFDFTGLGESEGEFADTNFTSNLEDLVAAANFLRQTRSAPRLLIGHSLGGAAVLAAAEFIEEARAVATIGAPCGTRHLKEVLESSSPELANASEANVLIAGRTIRVKRQLLEDLTRQALPPRIARLGRALLVMHSPDDDVVPIDHARRIYESARHPKSFVSLDGADHLLVRRESDARFTANVLAAWAARYVGNDRDATETTAPVEATAAEGSVRVIGDRDRFKQRVIVGRHSFVADEPTGVGGADCGPGPYDLLLAALGACTSMTLRMYADRKRWPLDEVDVSLSHGRIHAEDCSDCESEKGMVDVIERSITLRGELDDAKRERLMEIADRCPVHRTLTSEIKIRTRREDGS